MASSWTGSAASGPQGARSTMGSWTSSGRNSGGLDVAGVEERLSFAVGEEDAVAAPVEAVGEGDLALGAGGGAGEVDDGHDLLAGAQLDLRLRFGRQRVCLPDGHKCQELATPLAHR